VRLIGFALQRETPRRYGCLRFELMVWGEFNRERQPLGLGALLLWGEVLQESWKLEPLGIIW